MPPKAAVAQGLQYVSVRRATFTAGVRVGSSKRLTYWPHDSPTPQDMAEAGFFYTPTRAAGDQATCFWCGKKQRAWAGGRPVASVHHALHDKCPYAAALHFLAEYKAAPHMPSYWRRLAQHDTLPAAVLAPHSRPAVRLRLATFQGLWKFDGRRKTTASARAMAAAGFFFLPAHPGDDRVICLYCGCPLADWAEDDDPLREHALNSRAYRLENGHPPCHFLATLEDPLEDDAAPGAASELQHIPAQALLPGPPADAPSSPLNTPRDRAGSPDVSIDQLSGHGSHVVRPARRYPRRARSANSLVLEVRGEPAAGETQAGEIQAGETQAGEIEIADEIQVADEIHAAGETLPSADDTPADDTPADDTLVDDALVDDAPADGPPARSPVPQDSSSFSVPNDTADADYSESVQEASSLQRSPGTAPPPAARSQFSDGEFGLSEKDIACILNSPKKHRRMRVLAPGLALPPPPAVYDISDQNLGDYDEHNLSFLERDLRIQQKPPAAPDSSVVEIKPEPPRSPQAVLVESPAQTPPVEGGPRSPPSASAVADGMDLGLDHDHDDDHDHDHDDDDHSADGGSAMLPDNADDEIILDAESPRQPEHPPTRPAFSPRTLPVSESTGNDLEVDAGPAEKPAGKEPGPRGRASSASKPPASPRPRASPGENRPAVQLKAPAPVGSPSLAENSDPVEVGSGPKEPTSRNHQRVSSENNKDPVPQDSRQNADAKIAQADRAEGARKRSLEAAREDSARKKSRAEDHGPAQAALLRSPDHLPESDTKRLWPVNEDDLKGGENRARKSDESPTKDVVVSPSSYKAYMSAFEKMRDEFENRYDEQVTQNHESSAASAACGPSDGAHGVSQELIEPALEDMSSAELEPATKKLTVAAEIDLPSYIGDSVSEALPLLSKSPTPVESKSNMLELETKDTVLKETVQTVNDHQDPVYAESREREDSKNEGRQRDAPKNEGREREDSKNEDRQREASKNEGREREDSKNEGREREDSKNEDRQREASKNDDIEREDSKNDDREKDAALTSAGLKAVKKDQQQDEDVLGRKRAFEINDNEALQSIQESHAAQDGVSKLTEKSLVRPLELHVVDHANRTRESINHLSFLDVQSSTPLKTQKEASSATKHFLPRISMDSALAEIKDLDDAIDYITQLAAQGHELHNDVDGALTNFISAMPEEEEEMTVEEWIRHNAASCRKIVEDLGEQIVQNYEAEFDKVINYVAGLATID